MRLPRPLQDIRTIKLLLTTAEAEAHRGGDDLPGPEHLLLSALELPDGTARRAFERIGVDPGGFRAAIEAAHRAALQGIGLAAPDGCPRPPSRRCCAVPTSSPRPANRSTARSAGH
jgi:hypothetical protein